jgi:hypothetical protein
MHKFEVAAASPSEKVYGIHQGVPCGNTIGALISSRFSVPHSSSTSVNAKGNAVPK